MRMFGEKLNLVKLLSCVAVVALVSMPAVAAVTCDDEDALINPALALCSTHVYNVGGDKNPSDGADREMMREVVALKTTVMTQQMYKQYEYLESMIRRFKTQLEKAVLKTRLQTSGAGDDSSGGASSKSDDKYIILTGTQNCMKMGSIDASLSCLQSNIRIAMDAISAGNTRDASKQLKKDLDTAVTMGVVKKEHKSVEGDKVITTADTTYDTCYGMSASKRDTVSDCATKLNYALMNYVDNRNWERAQKKDK